MGYNLRLPVLQLVRHLCQCALIVNHFEITEEKFNVSDGSFELAIARIQFHGARLAVPDGAQSLRHHLLYDTIRDR